MDAIRRLIGNYRYTAIAVVTVLTLAIIGSVVLTTTSVGCGPANKLGLKTTRCLQGGSVALVGSPSPTARPVPTSTPRPSATGTPANSPSAPPSPPSTPNYQPNAPYNPAASGAPPYQNLASSDAPPLAYPASGLYGGTFSCRLPVFGGAPGSGGFIVFPDQTFIADPRSAVTVPSPSPGVPSPSQGPVYAGWYGESYDAKFGRWLAVPYAWVSPDGSHYAYPLGGDIYVQDLAHNSQLDLAAGKGYSVLGTANDGVYVTAASLPGLWFLPYSGTPKQVTAAGYWQVVGNGFAYGTPTASVPPGAFNTIERLDIGTGTIAPYFSEQGVSHVLGLDPLGNPVIQVIYVNSNAIFIATGPNTSVAIATVTNGYSYPGVPPFPYGTPMSDGHGVWFSAGNGVVLYRNLGWYWMSSIGGQLAGPCA